MTAGCVEVFSPVMAHKEVHDESEAFARANGLIYGPNPSRSSRNWLRARCAIARLRGGSATLNEVFPRRSLR